MEHRDTEAWYQERHRLTEVLMAAKPGEEHAKAFRDLQEWNALDSTVQAAERVSAKFRELASVLQEWDTSAAEASTAFQDLQDWAASSPLDAEQIRKDAAILASFHGVPREPWYKRLWYWLRGTK